MTSEFLLPNLQEPITLDRFKSSFEQYKKYIQEIQIDSLTLLWFDDYYDGMLSGKLEYENQKFRFEIITDYQKLLRPRVFAIINLTEKQIEEEEYWHHLFEEHVGSKTYSLLNKESLKKTMSEHNLFYSKYQKKGKMHYNLNVVIAWYAEHVNNYMLLLYCPPTSYNA